MVIGVAKIGLNDVVVDVADCLFHLDRGQPPPHAGAGHLCRGGSGSGAGNRRRKRSDRALGGGGSSGQTGGPEYAGKRGGLPKCTLLHELRSAAPDRSSPSIKRGLAPPVGMDDHQGIRVLKLLNLNKHIPVEAVMACNPGEWS